MEAFTPSEKSQKAEGMDFFVRELKEQEKKIRDLEQLVETIGRGKYMWESTFDAIADPVMIVSPEYKILRANKAAANAGNIDVRKMIGTTCYETLAGFKKPCRGCPLKETIKSKSNQTFSLDPFLNGGRHYQVHSYHIRSELAPDQVVLYYRDVTQEKKLHRELLQIEKMAAIGTLAGGVAHEINNPLGGILAFVQLVMREIAKDHPSQNDLKEIEEAALRCKRIVQDLLDFSRQHRDEKFGPIILNDIIEKMVPLIKIQAKNIGVEINLKFDPHLLPVEGSSHKLQQVFLNLITNAYYAMKKGGVLTIKTYMNASKTKVLCDVNDTGEGIPSAISDKIFDPYFTTKKQGEGTGLGLSITYGIIQEHKGHIDVFSKLGVGTTFTFSFPVSGNG
ncbi:MAG: hypothetical protein A2048_02280 [Deltaproteobacteria bacterium GWA2_45_12]|nr:MAG: hypothetical protein A2048_02280 [Deltaproteobacteria bacterium GWA2_45_12]